VARVPHAPMSTAAPPTDASAWVFLLFFQIVLNFCSVSIYPSHCFVHRKFDRLHSASSRLYVIAEAPFCWLGLFVAIVGIICVVRVTVMGYFYCEYL
jgi:hypothetical protein